MCQLSSARTSPGLVSLPGSVQLLHKITNAKTVGAAGTSQFKILVTGNIDMWRHPKYYKELRKRNKELQAATRDLAGVHSDQAISDEASTEATSVRPGPGPKHQASSVKLTKSQASSGKHQAPSSKHQA